MIQTFTTKYSASDFLQEIHVLLSLGIKETRISLRRAKRISQKLLSENTLGHNMFLQTIFHYYCRRRLPQA
jgi:hypothetical protein